MAATDRADPQRFAELSAACVDALREAFVRHGYDAQMLGGCESWAINQLDTVRMPLVWYELRRRDDGAAAIARLFAYDDAVARERIESIFGSDQVQSLIDVGALYQREGGRASRVRIVPLDPVWIASDDFARTIDPVIGPGATTLHLAAALDTEGIASLLDIGCGAGSLALLARARGVAEVVGVD